MELELDTTVPGDVPLPLPTGSSIAVLRLHCCTSGHDQDPPCDEYQEQDEKTDGQTGCQQQSDSVQKKYRTDNLRRTMPF